MTLFRSLLIAILLLAISSPSHSQVETAGEDASGVEQIPDSGEQDLYDAILRIREKSAALKDLDGAFDAAVGEAKESIILQRLDRYQALVAEMREFSAKAAAYRESGGDVKALLGEFGVALLSTGKTLRSEINAHRKRFKLQNRERDTQTLEGLKGYIFDSRQVDTSFSLLAEYIDVVESVGYGAEPSIAYIVEHLPERADVLAGRLRLSNEREAEYKRVLAVNAGDTETQAKLLLLEQKLEADTRSLQQIIGLAANYNLDMSRYQTLLVKTTGEITANLFDGDVMAELFHDWWLSTKHSIQSNTANLVLKILVFAFILLVFKGLAVVVSKLILRSVKSAKVNLSVLMQDMLISMSSRMIMLLGLLVALAQVGVSLGPVLAGLGVVGFVIGFALQDTLGNFAAGVMILVYRPYDVGDYVDVAGEFGMVKSMNIVSTTILTIDNQTLIIPNSKIWGDVIKNVTAQKVRRVDMVFGIGYGDNVEHAEKVLRDILVQHDKVLSSPQAVVKLHKLGDSSCDFVVRPWAKTDDYWDVYWDVTRAVKMRFDAEGISIPFPQRDVHVYHQGGGNARDPLLKTT